jgi:hypothetical protein
MTLLTTRKMDPALAARIEASVRGARRPGGSRVAPRVVAMARVLVIVVVVAVYLVVAAARRRELEETEHARKALLDAVRAPAATVTAEDEAAVARAESWLTRLAGPYDGDVVEDEVRPPGAFAATLARPVLYVRGPIGAFTRTASIAGAASTSVKDAFLLCLLAPPASRDEPSLLSRVRDAYAGGAPVEGPTTNVRRMHDAEAGLPVLMPRWSERVRMAAGIEELEPLRRQLERAPLDGAARAAKARLLLVAMDEPGDDGRGSEPTELDGERAHRARVALVDLAADRLLVRLRRGVDPSSVSPPLRAEYASGLDACALAVDVREAVTRHGAK